MEQVYLFNKWINALFNVGYEKLNPESIIFFEETRIPFKSITDISPNIVLRTKPGIFGSQKGFFNTLAIAFENSIFVTWS
ncbi:MAG: hypothetical protein ACI9EK_000954, partial [Psychroserpens sp.]